MDVDELASSGRRWPHPVPSPDGRVVGIDGLRLPIPAQPHPYLALMARFSNGAQHARRRAAVVRALPAVAGLEDAARRSATEELDGMEPIDVVPLALTVPVRVLGAALGVGDLSAEIAALCDTDAVAERLPGVAVTSLLYQCRDATAALILNALADDVPVERAVSVVLTRRAGDVRVLLDGGPYGSGAHACPGREHALALARGVVAALAGWTVVERGPNQRRPTIRMPQRLLMDRR